VLSRHEIEKITSLSQFLHRCLRKLESGIIPGMDGLRLRALLESFIYDSYPAAQTVSFDVNVNYHVCHCSPDVEAFQNGDIITLDLVLIEDGLFADGAWTFICGEKSNENKELVQKAWDVSVRAFKAIKEGSSSLILKKAVHNALVGTPYSLIEDACGHGIGKSVHEIPDISYSLINQNDIFWKKGMVFTVEPVISLRNSKLFLDNEKGYITNNLSPSAYFEHMVSIDQNGVHCLNIPQINNLDCIDIFSEII